MQWRTGTIYSLSNYHQSREDFADIRFLSSSRQKRWDALSIEEKQRYLDTTKDKGNKRYVSIHPPCPTRGLWRSASFRKYFHLYFKLHIINRLDFRFAHWQSIHIRRKFKNSAVWRVLAGPVFFFVEKFCSLSQLSSESMVSGNHILKRLVSRHHMRAWNGAVWNDWHGI